MQKETTEPTSVTIHHLKSQKKKASAMLAFSLENNWITVAA
ncbi:hypothetical protein L910_3576 [Vibrio fluvialis PG41]|uniref:Uncharacterized protein n=1 Tax=Vibrio fluvialis PG41 TaxID=1336752 RepID=S7I6U8_VIBFL|nr:hypothetical protein L910_3576 [Vibrio fluvialis PG41]